jgi:hypothetical protein
VPTNPLSRASSRRLRPDLKLFPLHATLAGTLALRFRKLFIRSRSRTPPIKLPHQPPLGDFFSAKSERPSATGALKDHEKRALVEHAPWNRRGGMVSSRSAERWHPSRSRRRRRATRSSPLTAGSQRPADGPELAAIRARICLCNLPMGLQGPFRGLCLCPGKLRFPTSETGVDRARFECWVSTTESGRRDRPPRESGGE